MESFFRVIGNTGRGERVAFVEATVQRLALVVGGRLRRQHVLMVIDGEGDACVAEIERHQREVLVALGAERNEVFVAQDEIDQVRWEEGHAAPALVRLLHALAHLFALVSGEVRPDRFDHDVVLGTVLVGDVRVAEGDRRRLGLVRIFDGQRPVRRATEAREQQPNGLERSARRRRLIAYLRARRA